MLKNSSRTDASIIAKLVDLHLREKNLIKAMDLYNSNEDFSFSQQAMESVVELLIEEKKPYDALNLVKKDVVEKDRKMFYSCLMKLLTGLIEVGDHKAVMETLEMIPKKSLIQLGPFTSKLLGAYADRGDIEQLNEVNLYLVSNDWISTEKLDNLVALVDVYLVKDDLSGALLEMKRIAKLYKKMPRKFPLTCRLIEENNSEAVEELLGVSTELYGEEASIYDLAHCFLALGKKDQARNLLETPGLRCDNMKLVWIFDQLANKKQVANAEALIGVSKRMHGGDRNMLFSKLLKLCSDDPDKIEDIWLQIQEEGFVPSNNLLVDLANCLKKHGRVVPFAEPTEVLPSKDVLPDMMVSGAIRKRHIRKVVEMVMRSFDDETFKTTLKCKRNTIEFLINNRKFKEAARISKELAQRFEKPEKILFKEYYLQIIAGLGKEKGMDFYKDLPEGLKNMLDLDLIPNLDLNSEEAGNGEFKSKVARVSLENVRKIKEIAESRENELIRNISSDNGELDK